jgi:hypothetical protein
LIKNLSDGVGVSNQRSKANTLALLDMTACTLRRRYKQRWIDSSWRIAVNNGLDRSQPIAVQRVISHDAKGKARVLVNLSENSGIISAVIGGIDSDIGDAKPLAGTDGIGPAQGVVGGHGQGREQRRQRGRQAKDRAKRGVAAEEVDGSESIADDDRVNKLAVTGAMVAAPGALALAPPQHCRRPHRRPSAKPRRRCQTHR